MEILKRFKYIIALIKFKINGLKKSIYYAKGVHLITGYMGAGKTLFMSHLLNDIDTDKYFIASNIAEFKHENVYTFDLKDLFKDGKQVKTIPKEINGKKLYAVVVDEINKDFNRRLNKSAEYNNIFCGLIEMLLTMRHQHINRFYLIGQFYDLQDTQLQTLIKYRHSIIKTRLYAPYWFFSENGYILYMPKKITILNEIKALNNEYEFIKKEKIKFKMADYKNYNTLGFNDYYKSLGNIYLKGGKNV